MIWIIATFSIVWIMHRGYMQHKMILSHSQDDSNFEKLQNNMKSSIAQTALVIILVWWISFMLLEVLKNSIFDYQTTYNYQWIAILTIGFTLVVIHFVNNRFISKKYNVRIYDKIVSFERTLCIIISLIYALIASYAAEAIIIFAT